MRHNNGNMSELDRIYKTMQSNFKEVFEKLDKQAENQICNNKDIEYIKKELQENKENKKENKKLMFAIVTSAIALFGTLLNLILG